MERDESVWVIVCDGPTRYIGKVNHDLTNNDDLMVLDDAFEMVIVRLPQQVPGQGIGLLTNISPSPIGLCAGTSRVRVKQSVVQYVSDLPAHDQSVYRRFIADAEREFSRRRAEAAGISLASSMPKG